MSKIERRLVDGGMDGGVDVSMALFGSFKEVNKVFTPVFYHV